MAIFVKNFWFAISMKMSSNDSNEVVPYFSVYIEWLECYIWLGHKMHWNSITYDIVKEYSDYLINKMEQIKYVKFFVEINKWWKKLLIVILLS